MIAKKLTVEGHALSHWSVGNIEFVGWFTRNYLGVAAVKERLEQDGWRVNKIEDVPFGIYYLSAERDIVEESTDEPAGDGELE